ncbi:MAG: hypothetical protein D3910_09690, partial [Candidatus Electrothrix sp. ATG2]|nr:hypothetical protein [Candidatus Electrothrix sp. ATG2]
SFDRTWIGSEAKVDYAFAEWSFSDQLTFQGGKVNAPFMLYADIDDVRTARPFFNLPLGIYHDAGVEAYKGIGLTGTFSLSKNWTIQCDIYGGTMVQHPNRRISKYFSEAYYDDETPVVDENGNPEFDEYWYLEIPDQAVEKMIGGRIMVSPPLDGLRFGLSAYTGDQKYYESGSLTEYEENWVGETLFNTVEQPIFAGFSIEYLSDSWELRSEYLATYQDDPRYQANRAYAEAAYRFTEHWQAAVRYEHNTIDEFSDQGFLNDFDSLRGHKELVIGLNYWFTPRMVVKASYHMIQGNGLIGPADDEKYMDGLDDGSFSEEETQLVRLGVQFSF